MTDERPDPGADRLAHVLAAVAVATPTPDRRADLLALIGTVAPNDEAGAPLAEEAEAVVPLTGAQRPASRRWPRLLLAAAAVVIVLGAVVALAGRGGDDAVDTGPAVTPPVAPPEVGPRPDPGVSSGWFLPGPGWTVTGVTTDYLDVGDQGGCPCTLWFAARPGDDPAVLGIGEESAQLGPDGDTDPLTGETVDVDGRVGEVFDWDGPGPISAIRVEAGDRLLNATFRGLSTDEVVVVLDAWADMVEAGDPVVVDDLPLPDGFVGGAPGAKDGTFETMVIITARRDADGAEVDYQLVPTGYHAPALLTADEAVADGGSFVATGDDVEGPFVLRTGGPVDVLVGGTSVNGAATSAEDVADLAAGLHEVDTATWRAALPADVEPDVADAPTLYDPPLTGP